MAAKNGFNVQEKVNELSGGMKAVAGIMFVAMVILGFVLVFRPVLILIVFPLAIGFYGLFLILRYLRMKEGRKGWDLICGIINIIFAVLMLVGGTGTLGVYVMIEIMVAFWAIFMGFSNIFNSFSIRKDPEVGKSWIWMLICGILAAVCGFFLLVKPIVGTYFTFLFSSIYVGISMIFIGFGGLAAVLSGKKAAGGSEGDTAA